MKTVAAAIPVAALLAALVGCKPKAGGDCTGPGGCVDDHTQLSCVDGKYLAMPCAGKGGCVATGDLATCDIRGNAAGDPCLDVGEHGAYCSPDGKSQIECTAGKTKVTACDGAGGCTEIAETGKTKACRRAPRLGEACFGEDDVCLDPKTRGSCAGMKWIVSSLCRGPRGCWHTVGPNVACDTSVGDVGDTCSNEPWADRESCSSDGKSVVACERGHLAKSRDCPGPKGCTKGNEVACDEGKH